MRPQVCWCYRTFWHSFCDTYVDKVITNEGEMTQSVAEKTEPVTLPVLRLVH